MGPGLMDRPQPTRMAWREGAAEEAVDHTMRRWWRWGAWVPVALLVVATLVLWGINPQGHYNAPRVVLVLNLTTRAVAWLLVSYLMGRSLLAGGAPAPLFFSLGVTFWGAGGV